MISNLSSVTPSAGAPVKLLPAPAQEPVAQLPADQVDIQRSSEPVILKQKPPVGSFMEEMLEKMEQAETRSKAVGQDMQKAVLSDIRATGGIVLLDETAPRIEHSESIDGALAKVLQQSQNKTEPHQEAHGSHHPPEHNGLLGGHLGIEGGEHLAHELLGAKSEALGSHSDMLDAAVGAGKEGAHHVAQHGSHAAHEVANQATHAGHEVANHAAESAHGTSEVLNGTTDAVHHATSLGMEIANTALASASGGLGGVMIYLGARDLTQGIAQKNGEAIAEGANGVVVGTRSLAAGLTLAGHVFHGSELMTAIGGAASTLLTPLGLVHGAVDAGLGTKEIIDGVKEHDRDKQIKGGLGVGLGAALMGAAAAPVVPLLASVGTVPFLVAAGIFLTGKVFQSVRMNRKHHAAEQQEQQQQQHQAAKPGPELSEPKP